MVKILNKEITLLIVLCISVFLLAILVYQNIENTQPKENTTFFEGQTNTPEQGVKLILFLITFAMCITVGWTINKSRNGK